MGRRLASDIDTTFDVALRPAFDPAAFETEDHGPNWVHASLVRGIGLVTWLVLLAPIWAALLFPALWAIAFAAFCLYWLIESITIAYRGIRSDQLLRRGVAINWRQRSEEHPAADRIQHLVVLPTYREPIEVVEESLNSLLEQDAEPGRLNVVIAAEQRDPEGVAMLTRLSEEFSERFNRLILSVHPDRRGEVPGKASNVNWAVRHAAAQLIAEGVRPADVLVSICDADSRLHHAYLSALTCLFLDPAQGGQRLYQPFHLLHANLERAQPVMRLVAAIYSIIHVGRVTRRFRYVQSTYSLPLSLAIRMGFWDADVIPEDSHTTFKARFRVGKQTRPTPVPVPVWGDVAEGRTLREAYGNHFRQVRRWSWGAYDIPYAFYQAFRAGRGERLDALVHSVLFAGEHLLWPTHWFLLTFGLVLIQMPTLGSTAAIVVQTAAWLGSIALACCWPALVVLIWLDCRLRRLRHPVAPGPGGYWLLLPLAGLPFFSLPAVDAHTRLLLIGKLPYEVTPKRAPESLVGDAAAVAPTLPSTKP